MKLDSTQDTLVHIDKVANHIKAVIAELKHRAATHDASKLISPEKEGFDEVTEKLKTLLYNSPEYKQSLADLKPTLDHHYAKNRHHPEHFPNGVSDMTIVDVIEMLCDWKAATERVKDGNIATSISKNTERFGISPQLAQILNNTVREFGWI